MPIDRLSANVLIANKAASPLATFTSAAKVTLAPGVSLVRASLLDQYNGRSYPLRGAGLRIAQKFAGDHMSLRDVARDISAAYGADLLSVERDIRLFASELESRALISTRQSYVVSWLGRLGPFKKLLIGDGAGVAQPLRRYPPNLLSVAVGCLEAPTPVLQIGIVGISVAVLAKAIPAWTQGVSVLSIAASVGLRPMLALLVWTAIFMGHEMGHLMMARALGIRVRSVVVRMGASGITYEADAPALRLAVATAGPLAALGVAITIAWFISTHPTPIYGAGQIEVGYSIVLGLAHLAALRPWGGDGRQATKAIADLVRIGER